MPDLSQLYNVADVREQARRRLPKGIFEFIDRGTEDDAAVQHNRAGFARLHLRPRIGIDVSTRSTGTRLFGQDISMPLAIAPTGAAGLVWYQGELELARAAAAAGVPFTLATRSMTSIEDIADKAGGQLWFQLYVWTERNLSYGLVERAQAAGCKALIVTLDVPVPPNREYNQRNGFSLPFDPKPRTMLDIACHPRWAIGVMGRYLSTTGMPRYENQPGEHRQRITQGGKALKSLQGDDVTWEDIATLRKRWNGPLLVKGVLRVEDALRALKEGADGIVVSNHGGRCLDCAVAPIDVLPEIADAVSGRGVVLLDSGVRRGTDIAKALSLGASAVLSGRPALYGMAVAGRDGANRVIELLRAELLTCMAMLGCPTVASLDRHLLHEDPNLVARLLAAASLSGPGKSANHPDCTLEGSNS